MPDVQKLYELLDQLGVPEYQVPLWQVLLWTYIGLSYLLWLRYELRKG